MLALLTEVKGFVSSGVSLKTGSSVKAYKAAPPRHKDHNNQDLPWFKVADLVLLAGLVTTAPLSWATPERLWRIYTFPVAFFKACLQYKGTRSRIRNIALLAPNRITRLQAACVEIRVIAANVERNFQYLREFSPLGWRPEIRVIGVENINNALAAGRGGILWVAPFSFNQLVVKKGLHEVGFRISHLSSYRHGQSGSRFGQRFINPIRTKPESSYVDERIIITPPGSSLAYVRRVERRLRENKLVSITCQYMAEKMIEVPMLNGRFDLATGPASFACATGAKLLPVFTIRSGTGKFDIIIEPPIELRSTCNRDAAVELLTQKYAKRVESFLIKFPYLFMHWASLRKSSRKRRGSGSDPGRQVMAGKRAQVFTLLAPILESMKGPGVNHGLGEETELLGRGIGLDSVEVLQLVTLIEKEYGVMIDDEELAPHHFRSVASLLTFIESKL
jgi:acyl carrier protein/lauroyl/myristoyl acyltransferase